MDPLEPGQAEEAASLAHEVGSELKACCALTIDQHADNNPMMVCSDCKQIIKCFDQERAFRNYKRFCQSRHRRILAAQYSKWWVVVFKSYDTYSS